jgi:AcrR family transcriptional regulator
MTAQASTTLDLGRRERRRAETQERILRAAIRLFESKGFAHTTVAEITQAADVGKGTFFNYFSTKEQVIQAILANFARQFDELEAGAARAADVRQYILRFVHRALDLPARSPQLVRTVFGMGISHPQIGKSFQQVLVRARKAVIAVLHRGQEVGQVRSDIPAEVLGRTFQQFILGTEIIWSITPRRQNLHQWVDVMFDVFWRGVSAVPESRDGRKEKVE